MTYIKIKMPINHGYDRIGHYLRWGMHGKKYYFNPNSRRSFHNAHEKALRQGVAIMYRGYRRKRNVHKI
jgi:hypothetical protein